MTEIHLDQIVIGERARRDYGDMTDLMESIQEHGILSPITLLPGNRLLCGGRRVEAARALGLESVPFHIAKTQDDALARIKAERDENTCRKDMTPEELVNIGLEIEELERPKAQARQAEGGRAGAESRWGDGLGPAGPKPSEKPETNRTAAVVGDALGVSTNTYKRAKHVVQTARGDNNPTPEVQEAAQEALKEMNEGQTTITGAYNKVRKARAPKGEDAKLTRPQPPRYGGNRKKHAAVIDSINVSLSGLAMAADEISEFDTSVTAEKAAQLVGDLSTSIRSLNRLKQNLNRKKATA